MAAELRHVSTDRTIVLAGGTDIAHTAAGSGTGFADRCAQAGLAHCSAYRLRKAGATRRAEAGATEHGITAVPGHRLPREDATGTKTAQRSRRADSAFARLAAPNGTRDVCDLPDKRRKIAPQTPEKENNA